MVDILGYRRKLGLIVPSFNTVALADAQQASLTGVTVHVSDFLKRDSASQAAPGSAGVDSIPEPIMANAFERMSERSVHSTALLLDEDFFGATDDESRDRLAAKFGLANLVTPTLALRSALQQTQMLRRAALLTPFSNADSNEAARRIESMGCQIVRSVSLGIPSPRAGAQVTFVSLRTHYESLLGDDVDGVIQLGHNLPLGRLVSNLEEDFGKPVLSINFVCMWKMLRGLGIEDVVPGVGRLLLDF